MKVKDIFKVTDLKSFDLDFIKRLRITKPNLTSDDKRFLLKKISKFKTSYLEETIKSIAFLAIWEADESIEVSRRKGVFRYRSYGFDENKALIIIDYFLSNKLIYNFSDYTINYLFKKKELKWIYDFYKRTEKKIVRFIINHHSRRKIIRRSNSIIETALFKELLVFIDDYFHEEYNQTEHLDKNIIEGYCREDVAEGVSYIIYLYDDKIGISNDIHYSVDPVAINSQEIKNAILNACQVNQMEEFELYIDYFNYEVELKDNDVIIYSLDEMLEKSITMGYIRRVVQEHAFILKAKEVVNNAQPISDLLDYAIKRYENSLICEIDDGQLSRYLLQIPEPLIECFGINNFFREEIMVLTHLSKELILTTDEFLKKKVTKSCTMKDVLFFHRFFQIMQHFTSKVLYTKPNLNKILCSLVPHLREQKFKELLSRYIDDECKLTELIDIFTYKPGSYKLDLQYTPFIKASSGYFFSNTIVSMSNLPRNIIAYSYMINNQVVNNDDGLEPLVTFCEKMFRQAGYHTVSNKKYKYQGAKGEVDVIASNQTSIVLMECKCPLNPTSIFELRSSYCHIEKASKQLDLITQALSDKAFRKNMLKQWGIKDENQELKTCIIFGNRHFSGYKYSRHPVRYIYELYTILTDGIIESEAGCWRIWKNETYSHRDLLNFLDDKKSFINLSYNALNKNLIRMKALDKKIQFVTYSLDQIETIKQFDKNLTLIHRPKEWEERLR